MATAASPRPPWRLGVELVADGHAPPDRSRVDDRTDGREWWPLAMEGNLSASDHDESGLVESGRRAATPVAGSIAGLLFAVLFGVCILLIRASVNQLTTDPGTWLQ